jgi:hypothetical protein
MMKDYFDAFLYLATVLLVAIALNHLLFLLFLPSAIPTMFLGVL